jgi:deoxyribodipyrimidine photo-lyase
MGKRALVWLRRDLRLADNPALLAATKAGDEVVALYVHETDQGLRQIGAAARWWLHESLQLLAEDLATIGIRLFVRSGEARKVVPEAVKEFGAEAVFWNRRYGPAERELDAAIKAEIGSVTSFCGHLLVEPWEISTGQGKPYSVFTPFWKAMKQRDIAAVLPAPKAVGSAIRSEKVDQDYRVGAWQKKLERECQIGEKSGRSRFVEFLDQQLDGYKDGRDIPGRDATSRLSPHLAFGEISARQVWHAAMAVAQRGPDRAEAVDKFLSELGWREFNYHQLYHRPDIATVPMQVKYDGITWRHDDAGFERWTKGLTGFPIVDAGMRELWATGVMQNRVRMLVASLLTKNLLIDWRRGEQWFWDTLVDADPASNPGNWQWVAGSGLDASPYFRIFNPVTQGERFDADGAYVRQWVPELAGLPDEWVQRPFDTPEAVLAKAGVKLGSDYPEPVVDLKVSRERALGVVKGL